MEIILLALAAVGVFYFFRACWRNIKRSRQHLGVALLTLMMALTAQTAQATTKTITYTFGTGVNQNGVWHGKITATGDVSKTYDFTANYGTGTRNSTFTFSPAADITLVYSSSETDIDINSTSSGKGYIGGGTPSKNWTLTISSSYYIKNVKFYNLNGELKVEQDNDSKTCAVTLTSDMMKWEIYYFTVTLSDTKPVITYNISYVLNGGTNAAGNPSTYNKGTGVASLAAPTRAGYTFGGWYDNAGFQGDAVTSIPNTSTGDVTLYAKWVTAPWAGAGTSAAPFQVASADELATLRTNVNNGTNYENTYFVQTAPITLNSDWTPIGTSAAPFKGHYDGGDNTISGLTVKTTSQYAGLFGYIKGGMYNGKNTIVAEVHNVVLENPSITITPGSATNGYAGAVVGKAGGCVGIYDCTVIGGTVTSSKSFYAGGIVGNYEAGSTIYRLSGNKVSGTTVSGGSICGGIAGYLSNSNAIYGNVVDATISATKTKFDTGESTEDYRQGAIAGYVAERHSNSPSLNYYHTTAGLTAYGKTPGHPFVTVADGNDAARIYSVTLPDGLSFVGDATATIGDTRYFAANATASLTADADKVITAFTAAGAASSSVAADKKSADITVGSSDVTVSAKLMALTGTSNGVTWSMSDSDSNGTIDRLTLSGSGTLSTSPWDAELAASITRVDISSADIAISGNPFSTLGSSAIIVVPSPAYGGSYTSADFADKLRAQFGSYLFGVTTEGGTAAYAIACEDDLRNLAAVINANKDASTAISGSGKTFRQTADITLSQTFTPIGAQGTYGKNFKGTYDGGDKTISGLTVNTDKQYAGLFGKVMGATIKNVRLIIPTVNTSFNVSGYACAGALVGYAMESSKVENCFVFSPNVSATNNQRYVGAIVGSIYSSSDKLTNSLFYSDANYGFAGNYANGNITNSGRARIVTLGSGIASVSPDASDMANGIVYQNKTYYREGVTLALSNNAPDGYFPVYSANGTEFSSDTYTVNSADGDVTLAATDRYAPITYTVHFDGNGSTSGEMADQTFVYDAAQNLTDNGYSRTITVTYNYNGATGGNNDATAIATSTFDGWATSADGAKVYDNQQSVSNLTTANGATLNLYAKWTDGSSVTLPTPTKTSCTFAGWYSDAGLTNKVGDAGESYTPSADITLYAKWGVAYIDADGNPQTCTNFTELTSSTDISHLSAGWYVVTEDVSYSSQFNCNSGDINLILCDGAKMTVDCGESQALYVIGSLTIYAQSTGSSMGQLEVKVSSSDHDGIYAAENVTICGGKITAGGYFGIYAYDNITLGWSNASDYIHASSYYAGGTVKIADGKTFWNGSEVLSGTISDMSALNGKTLTPISGVELTNNCNSAKFSGTSTEPVVIPAAIEVKAVSLERKFSAGKASTVMLPFDYTCNEADGGEFYDFAGVEKDKVTNQWVATMTKVNQLKANTPYMFVAANDIDGITFTLPEKVTLNTTGGGECQKADKGSHWTFKGTYSYMKWTSDTKDAEYTKERADEIGKVYGFAGVAKDDIKLGDFVKAASGARIRPLTCYLIWNNTPNSTRGMTRAAGDEELPSSIVVRLLSNIGPGNQGDDNGNQGNGDDNQGNGDDQGNDDNGGTTTIGTLDTETGEIDFGGWYTLSGRKLDTKPTQKGLYIHNGKKIVIK